MLLYVLVRHMLLYVLVRHMLFYVLVRHMLFYVLVRHMLLYVLVRHMLLYVLVRHVLLYVLVRHMLLYVLVRHMLLSTAMIRPNIIFVFRPTVFKQNTEPSIATYNCACVVFGRVRNFRKVTIRFVMSVCRSARMALCPHWKGFF